MDPVPIRVETLTPLLTGPLRARLGTVVRAMAEAEVAEELGREDLAGVPLLAETAEVLERRLLGMPRHFAAGMVLLTLAFDGMTVTTDGGRFTTLPLAQRRRALARVRAMSLGPVGLGPLGNFITFYDRMAPFIFWSQLEEHHLLEPLLGP